MKHDIYVPEEMAAKCQYAGRFFARMEYDNAMEEENPTAKPWVRGTFEGHSLPIERGHKLYDACEQIMDDAAEEEWDRLWTTDWRREWRETGLNPDRGAPDAKDVLIAELIEVLEAINKASNALHIEAVNVLGVFRDMELAERAGVARMSSYRDAFAASCRAGTIARAAIEKARKG